MSQDVHGIFFRDFDRDHIGHIVAEAYRDRVYDRFLMGRKGLNIIEAGANVGIVTLYLSRYADKLLAIEPCIGHFDILVRTITFNRIMENTLALRVALAGQDGDRYLRHYPGNTTSHNILEGPKEGGEMVQAVSFGLMLKTSGMESVDFLKLDVEGAEREIIDSRSFAEHAHRIKAMTVEWHYGGGGGWLESKLKDLGFNVQRIAHSGKDVIYAAWR